MRMAKCDLRCTHSIMRKCKNYDKVIKVDYYANARKKVCGWKRRKTFSAKNLLGVGALLRKKCHQQMTIIIISYV